MILRERSRANTICKFPVDHVSGSQLGGSFRVGKTIVRNDGLRGLYRGIGSNIMGNSVSWALYFVVYDRIKYSIRVYQGPLSYYDFFIASGAAGLLT